MLDTLKTKISNVAEEFIRLYAEYTKGEIDPEDVRKLTPEQQERLRIIMELAQNFDAMDEYTQITMLKKSVKTMIAINKMREIPEKVDAMFKGNVTIDELERLVLSIPTERLLESNDIDGITVYNEYCKSIYRLMLYANFIGRTKLFKIPEIQRIVCGMSKKEVHEIYGEPNLAPELRDAAARTKGKQPIPYELRQAIITADSSNDKNAYLNPNLLSELYAYKAEIVYSDVSEKLDEKLEEIGVVKESLIENKKKGRKALATGILCTTMTAVFLVWPIYNSVRLAIKAHRNKLYKPNITMEGENEATTYNAGELEFISGDEAQDTFNSKENQKRFITVFNTKPENKVEVKVYDYTDSDMTDEELKKVTLDDEKLVYHRTFDNVSDEIQNSTENFASKFTGNSSRNVSTISFSMERSDKISNSFQLYLCMIVIVNQIMSWTIKKDSFTTALINSVCKDFKKLIESMKNQKGYNEKLGTLQSELASLERQAKLDTLQDERLRAIAERNSVEEELSNYAVKPVGK